MIGFHAAPAAVRESIRREGLRAGRPADGNYGWELADQPYGVYVASSPEIAEFWAPCAEADIWEVDLGGLPTTSDPMDRSSTVVCIDVPPERLRLDRAYSDETI